MNQALPVQICPLKGREIPRRNLGVSLDMTKPGVIEVEGEVTEALPNTMFRVKVASGQLPNVNEDKIVLCHLSGRMRIHYVRILPGDKVKLEMTPYDLTKGRITFRYR